MTAKERRQIGFSQLQRLLRHRHPMILIDRITDHEPGVSLDARLSVAGNLDFIAGHFPGRAIYPGSHLIQACCQCGIILLQLSTSTLADDEMTLVSSVEARFFHPAVPGDQIDLRVTADRFAGDSFFFSGAARVEERRVAAFRGSLARVKVASLGEPLW